MKSFTKIVETVYEPLWVRAAFSVYNKDFMRIRSAFEYKCDHCEKCDYKFQLGDNIGLAAFKNIGNKVMCDSCVKEINL